MDLGIWRLQYIQDYFLPGWQEKPVAYDKQACEFQPFDYTSSYIDSLFDWPKIKAVIASSDIEAPYPRNNFEPCFITNLFADAFIRQWREVLQGYCFDDVFLNEVTGHYVVKLADLLVDAGADLNRPNRFGCRPLDYILFRSDVPLTYAEKMIQHGADPFIPLESGKSFEQTMREWGKSHRFSSYYVHLLSLIEHMRLAPVLPDDPESSDDESITGL